MGCVEKLVRQFEDMKIRGLWVAGSRWRDLSLAHRRRMNEVLLKVREAREVWWRSESFESLKEAVERICERQVEQGQGLQA